MFFDTHMHTRFSTDSRMTLAEAKARAKQLGIGIIITEHMDLCYPEPTAFVFDVPAYFAEYEQHRSESLLLGIELGLRIDCQTENNQIANTNPFDYVIGSIHFVGNIDVSHEALYRGRQKPEVYREYFAAMLECVKIYDSFDSLGHIDYICRYARFDDQALYYHEYKEQIDQILSVLAAKNKALEINTRRLRDKNATQALIPIYRRFRELGGTMATIGSDAHNPQDIGRDMDTALAVAKTAGLSPVYFKNRRPVFI